MAGLVITPQALACIRERIERDHIQEPLVVVNWAPGAADVRRSAGGEAIWERQPSHWIAAVLDLTELEEAGAPWSGATVELHGYSFSLIGKRESPQLESCTLTCEGGELVVYESAI